ncbi:hypothetical protein LguiB_001589 [Lonicera macranthoides]
MEIQTPFTFITFPILFCFILFFFFKISKTHSRSALPPGPWKLPLLGNILQLAAGPLPHRTLKDLAQKHGPLMHLQLGQISSIVISSPRLAKEVLKRHDLAFADRPGNLASEIISYNNITMAFAPYGDYWRQMRKICTLELLTVKKVRSFAFIREDEVWHLLESIKSSISSSRSPAIINISAKIASLTSSIVCRASFGSKCKDQDALIKLIQEIISLAGGFDVADLFPSVKFLQVISGMKPKLEKLHWEIDQILNNIIDEHRNKLASTKTEEEHHEDLLDILLRLKESGNLEVPITSNNVKAVMLDMLAAGTDTSSVTIEWAISEMIRNPRVMDKAQAELRNILKGKKIVRERDIEELSYLKLVIKETLRLHPPVPLLLPRLCREECEIDGYIIPKQTKAIVNYWAIGRDKECWDDAESFKPERFDSSAVDFTGTNMEYIPFGAGRRMCPGMSFGIANVELPLAQLLYHFNWELPDGKKPQDLDMFEAFGAVVRRRNDLLARVDEPKFI